MREAYKRFVEYENVLAKVGAKSVKCDDWMNAQFTVFNGADFGSSLTQVDTLADAYKVCYGDVPRARGWARVCRTLSPQAFEEQNVHNSQAVAFIRQMLATVRWGDGARAFTCVM